MRHQRGGQPGVELAVPLHVAAQARRHPVGQHLDDAAEGVGVLLRRVDLGDHPGAGLRVEAAQRVGVDARRRPRARGSSPGLAATEPSSTTCETISMPSACRSSALATVPTRDPGGGLPGAGPLQDRPGVGVPVLLHAGQVGVARAGAGSAARCGPGSASSSGSTGSAAITVCHFGHSVLPTRIATGLPSVSAVPQAADDLDLVLLERHPRAPAVAEPAPGQLAGDLRGGHLDPGGHALQHRDEGGPCDSPAVSQRNTTVSLSRPVATGYAARRVPPSGQAASAPICRQRTGLSRGVNKGPFLTPAGQRASRRGGGDAGELLELADAWASSRSSPETIRHPAACAAAASGVGHGS